VVLVITQYSLPEPRTDFGHPLAQLVQEKTGGNPFFAIQFFTALADEGLLWFDPVTRTWQWDMNRIRAKGSRKGTNCLAITRRRLQVRLTNRSWPASAPVIKVTIQSARSQLRGLQVRMRKGLLLLGSISWFLLMFAGLAVSANAQTTALNEWTWVGGSHSIPQLGNYGTLGVAAAGNLPGSRHPCKSSVK
jgi:hypothetical protein